LFLVLFLAAAALVAGARVAHGQAVNPSAIEFTSLDHSQIGTYRVCFYASATATQAIRCTDVPVAAAVGQGGSVFRIPRAAWQTGLSNDVNLYPKVGGIGTNGVETQLVAPATSPFFFILRARPRDVSDVLLVP
jgi:hypothetical protein